MNPLADAFEAHKEELAKMMALDMGKPVAQGVAEAEKCASLIRYYVKTSESVLRDKVVFDNEKMFSRVVYQPLGPVLQCAPL